LYIARLMIWSGIFTQSLCKARSSVNSEIQSLDVKCINHRWDWQIWMKCKHEIYAYDYANSGCHRTPKKNKEKITIFENTTTMCNLYYQSCEKQEKDSRNPNGMRYIVKDYCKKYPTRMRDQDINESNVVQPRNHLWADQEEISSWRTGIGRKSNTYLPTYGLC
jgi:hypothetical protein